MDDQLKSISISTKSHKDQYCGACITPRGDELIVQKNHTNFKFELMVQFMGIVLQNFNDVKWS